MKDTGSGEHEAGGFVPNYLLYLLAAASEAMSAEFHAVVRSHGVRVPEWRILACLRDQDGQMVTRLADFALMEQSRLTKTIDQMVASNLVTRGQDDADRRRVRLYLTRQGRELADKLVTKAKAHEAALSARLGTAEVEALRAMLQKINAMAGKPLPGDDGN